MASFCDIQQIQEEVFQEMAEAMSSTPAVPRFTRKDINGMQDQLISMNLEKEGLDCTGKVKEMRKRLLDHFYPTSHSEVINPGSDPGFTPLHDAAPEDTNLTSDPGFTPLHVAAPLDTNPASDSSIAPLHDAASVDTYPASDSGFTPLHDAAQIVEIQRERKDENINPTNDRGVTPLHQAPFPYTVDHIKGFMVEQLQNISLEVGLPILNEETNQKFSKPILREKLIAFIQTHNQDTNLNANHPESSQNILEEEMETWFLNLPRTGGVIKKIPKASRPHCSRTYCELLESLTVVGDKKSWERWFEFTRACLANPKRGGKKNTSLATVINKRVVQFNKGGASEVHDDSNEVKKGRKRKNQNPQKPQLDLQVAARLGIGDVKGAVRLVTSKDVVLPITPEVRAKLLEKHPPPHKDSIMPPFKELQEYVCTKEEVKKALRSFPNGSGGGPDGLFPQHLKDCTEDSLGDVADKLLEALTKFINVVVLPGKVPKEACGVFYGANLIALSKEDNGVRPIAASMTLRRLVAKIAMAKLGDKCEELFWPNKVGVGSPLGAEVAVHSVRKFLQSPSSSDMICLKTDFRNAYNTLRRDIALKSIEKEAPEIYKFSS